MHSNIKNSLSVVVPIYNVEKYLFLCVDSLCKALLVFENKEVICINDGSTDNSRDIIKKLQNKYDFIVLVDQENGGYGAAVNAGLNAAKGEYVTIVESDDAVLPSIYEKLIIKLNDNPEVDFIKTPYHVWIDGRITETIRMPDAPDFPFTAHEYPFAMMFPPSIWSAVYRRKFLDKNKIRVIETPGASYQDTFFSAQLFLLGGKLLYHDDAYLLYRNDRVDASRASRTKTTEIFKIHDELKKILEDKELFKGKNKYLYYAACFKRTLWFFSTVLPSFRENAFKLAYLQFLPVFNDQVLYSGLENELTLNERDHLSELKKGNYSYFHRFFGVTEYNAISISKSIQPQSDDPLTSAQAFGVNLFGIIFRLFIEKPKYNKLKTNPRLFFRDSKSIFARKIGSVLGVWKLPQPSVDKPTTSAQNIGLYVFGLLFSNFMTQPQFFKLKSKPRAFFRDTKSLFTRTIGLLLGIIK